MVTCDTQDSKGAWTSGRLLASWNAEGQKGEMLMINGKQWEAFTPKSIARKKTFTGW